MSYGIELINSSGKLVVGNVSKQLSFHQKISVSVAGWSGTEYDAISGGHLYVATTTLSDSSRKPIVYYEPANGTTTGAGYCPVRIYYESSRWKIAVARGTVTNQVVLYVFVEKNTGVGSWGIQTFDAGGNLAFDSDDRPVAISGITSISRGTDIYSDGINNIYGYDYEGTLGDGSVAVPTASRHANYAISVPPYLYGSHVGYPVDEFGTGHNEYIVGCLVKSSWNLVTRKVQIGGYTSNSGRPMSEPIWSTIGVSFIDGAMYS